MKQETGHEPSRRLASLDALRGFDMFWIVGGGAILGGLDVAIDTPFTNAVAAQLEHVPWEGLKAWDVIWPLFMFIVGAAIPFSLEKRRASGAGNRKLYAHAVSRAVILFILGMVVQGNLLAFDLSVLHPCYSVLHGIGAGYLIAFMVALHVRPGRIPIVIAVFLLAYWALVALIPVPGYGAGSYTECGNAATYIDQLVLGRFHFGSNTWFLSYLGFASSVLLGVAAGNVLRSSHSPSSRILFLAGTGLGSIIVGLVWSLAFPVIKLLWSASFVLVTGGISFLLMAIFYLAIDVAGMRKWAFPFVVIGMNPIAVYLATMLFDFRQIGNIFVGGLLPRLGPWATAVEAATAFLVVWLILYWMYRTKSFVKI